MLQNSTVAVFIDLENIFYPVWDEDQSEPNFKEIMRVASEHGIITSAQAFAPFAQNFKLDRLKIQLEIAGIESIDCPFVESGGTKKDYVDFTMLDAIYNTLATQPNLDTFVLGTGDGHFKRCISTLVNLYRKKVIITHTNFKAINEIVRCLASDIKIITSENTKEEKEKIKTIIDLSIKHSMDLGKYCTFSRTAEVCSEKLGTRLSLVKEVLSDMVRSGELLQKPVHINNREIMVLVQAK